MKKNNIVIDFRMPDEALTDFQNRLNKTCEEICIKHKDTIQGVPVVGLGPDDKVIIQYVTEPPILLTRKEAQILERSKVFDEDELRRAHQQFTADRPVTASSATAFLHFLIGLRHGSD